MTAEDVMASLRANRGVLAAHWLDGDRFARFCAEERKVQSSVSGIPVDNEAFEQTRRRDRHVCLMLRRGSECYRTACVQMKNESGDVVGFYATPETKEELIQREELVWISDDFALDPTKNGGDIRVVLPPIGTDIIGEAEGARDVILMSPSPSTDWELRIMFGMDSSRAFSTAVLSYNEIRSL